MKVKTSSIVSYPEKIIALWTVFLLGLVFHTQLALMPLFHGLSVAGSHAHDSGEISAILWGMLVFFLLPLIAIAATAFNDSKRYRVIHLGLTVFYTVMNLLHVVLDLFVSVPMFQIVLMVFLLVIGLLLNLVSFQWMKVHANGKTVLEMYDRV